MRGRSRATADRDGAQSSPCGTCGRTTKTVSRVCADCWAPKEPGARGTFARASRTEPLLDLDLDVDPDVGDPFWGLARLLVAVVVTVVVAAVAVILAG
jgi:hypothetical protein